MSWSYYVAIIIHVAYMYDTPASSSHDIHKDTDVVP